eukprot:TRINITY_DN11990_c0_g1_i1.p1 TRINITY_DN11990_c0_g1~~TRINITY_DN11990_c0_g1_i1.p1  ORF type:complete len:508 (+),score=168.09 TRINITY_DN11990_c0_g1_i1:83-1606(+)
MRAAVLAALGCSWGAAAQPQRAGESVAASVQVNGIFPHITATATSEKVRSEAGTGALMPWADRLYMVSYLSVPKAGNGTGLYEIDPNMTMTKIADHSSCYANRLLHPGTSQIVIGKWVIDTNRRVREITGDLGDNRLGGCAIHLTHPESMVYLLGMDGGLWEVDITPSSPLKARYLFDVVKELAIPSGQQPHFKAAYTQGGQLYVASNTFDWRDFEEDATQRDPGFRMGGRLGMFNGTAWTVLQHRAHYEIAGRNNWGRVVYAVGSDSRSVTLSVRDVGDGSCPSSDNEWKTYRLPKASHAYDHLWQTEWPRIREVETERFLLDAHGMFYELSPLGWAASAWGLRPVSQHLRMIPDLAPFRGMLAVGGNQVSAIFDNNLVTGQSQSGLWFGKTDDLWAWGKPQGWGGPWRHTRVAAGEPSDPYLMTGFDSKALHLETHNGTAAKVSLQIDYTGVAGNLAGYEWRTYQTFALGPDGYQQFNFPQGFSAQWVRFVADAPCVATAWLIYS